MRQAPLVWYKRLTSYLKTLDFQISISDPCVFWRRETASNPATWLFAHVDDIVIISHKPEVFRAQMEKEFEIKYPGEAEFLLGMNLLRFNDGIQINQTQYVERKLAEFGLDKEYPASCPLNPRERLSKATPLEIETLKKLEVNYRALVGSLNYLSILTRPDISLAVSQLSQYLENPGIKHYQAAIQVFRYLSGTKHVGLTFKKSSSINLKAFSDADWGNCPDTRRSTTGFVVTAGSHLLNWKSSKQPTVSLSTAEAEYKALSDLGRDLAWFASLIKEIELQKTVEDITVAVDNKGAIDLANSETSQNSFRTKHMNIRLHFVRELILANLIKLQYVKTNANAADFLTKALGRSVIRRSLAQIGVIQVSEATSNLATRSMRGCRKSGSDPNPQQPPRKLARLDQGASPAAIKDAEQARTLTVTAPRQAQTQTRTLTLAERLGSRTQADLLSRLSSEAPVTQQERIDPYRQDKTKLLQ